MYNLILLLFGLYNQHNSLGWIGAQGSVAGDIHSNTSNVDRCPFADNTSGKVSNNSRENIEIETFKHSSIILLAVVR